MIRRPSGAVLNPLFDSLCLDLVPSLLDGGGFDATNRFYEKLRNVESVSKNSLVILLKASGSAKSTIESSVSRMYVSGFLGLALTFSLSSASDISESLSAKMSSILRKRRHFLMTQKMSHGW